MINSVLELLHHAVTLLFGVYIIDLRGFFTENLTFFADYYIRRCIKKSW